MLYKKFKAFRAEHKGKKAWTRDEEMKNFIEELDDGELDKFTIKFYINSKFPPKEKQKEKQQPAPPPQQ